MLKSGVRTSKIDDVGDRMSRGVRRGLDRAASKGFSVSQEEVAKVRGSTGLMGSGFPPTWIGNDLVWGYTASHARAIEEGLDPGHWIPVDAVPNLAVWARRVLGAQNERDAAWRIRHKIGTEGTEAQPYVEPGFNAMVAELEKQGLSSFIDNEL